MKKKFFALFLCLCMLLSLVPANMTMALAEDGTVEMQAEEAAGEIISEDDQGAEVLPEINEEMEESEVTEQAVEIPEAFEDETEQEAVIPEAFEETEEINDQNEQEVIEEPEAEEIPAKEEQEETESEDETLPEEEVLPEDEEEIIVTGTIAHVNKSVNFAKAAPLVKPAAKKKLLAKAPAKAPADPVKDVEGLEAEKVVKDNEDGTYTITLDAYTTGTVKTETTAVPTDIVLVLDQSGSMDETYKSITTATYTKVEFNKALGTWWPKNGELNLTTNLFVKLDDGTYSRLEIYWVIESYFYVWTDENGDQQSLYSFSSLGECPDELRGKIYRMRTETTDKTRLEALKEAAGSFISNVQQDAAENGVDHRIAVVGFASNDENYNQNRWENTELLSTQTVVGHESIKPANYVDALVSANVNGSVNSRLTTAINRLDAQGGTYINNGLEMAQGVFNNATNATGRNRVVVILTDGTPGNGTWGNSVERNTCASDAISRANTMKSNGITVYTVGIFDGADATSAGSNTGSTAQKTNYFMQQLSSNNGKVSNPSYYLSADNPEALNNVFQSISEQINTPTINLGSSTVVTDVMTEYFDMPEGAAVKIYTAKAKADGSFENRVQSTDLKPVIDPDTQKISVTGFDFNANCVTETAKADGSYGKKLILEFTVEPKEGFLGGNNVPTNKTEGSGIYADGKLIENFVPDYGEGKTGVDVPLIDLELKLPDANVYENDDYDDLLGLGLEVSEDDGVNYKSFDVWYEGLEDWQKEFVEEFEVESSEETGKYEVSFVIEPKTEGSVKAKEYSANAKLNVFKPVLTFTDATVEFGTTLNTAFYTANNYLSGKTVWKCGDKVSTAVTMTGEEPEITVDYDPASTTAPAEGGDISVKVTVKTNGVSSSASFDWEKDDDCPDTCTAAPAGAQFRIHCKPGFGSMTITKSGCEDADADQNFVFHVVSTDLVNKNASVDMLVTVQGNNSVTIKDLPIGKYKVEEDSNWSWRYTADGEKTVEVVANETAGTEIVNKRTNNEWLNSTASVINTVNTNSGKEE